MRRAPKILAIVPSLIASCQINVLKPMKRLFAQGRIQFLSKLESKATAADVAWADVVIFCRNTEPAYGHLLNAALCAAKPIIYDLDDNFWDIPYDTDPELARYHRLPPRLAQLEKYLEFSTLVRVYSPTLEERVREFSSRTKLLKSGFDFSLVSQKRTKKSDKIRIVYATSRIVDDQYHEFLKGITQVLDKYGDRVSLTVWGCQPRELAGRRGVELVPLLPDYDKFLTQFYLQSFDIGLAPLPNTLFHRSKNNTKFRDYGACRVAGVYSNVDIYTACIEDGKTGIIVENSPESWAEGISRLIDNPQMLESIKVQAYKEVFDNYRQELVEEQWMKDISEVFSGESVDTENGIIRDERAVTIRADYAGLYGIRIPGISPEGEALGNLLFEVVTPHGSTLREASDTIRTNLPDGDVEFTFDSIENSSYREFVFRLISISDEAGSPPGWVPPSGHMQLLYNSRTIASFGARK